MKPCHAKSVACIASVVQQSRNSFYKRRACSFGVMRILVALVMTISSYGVLFIETISKLYQRWGFDFPGILRISQVGIVPGKKF